MFDLDGHPQFRRGADSPFYAPLPPARPTASRSPGSNSYAPTFPLLNNPEGGIRGTQSRIALLSPRFSSIFFRQHRTFF